MRRGIKVAAWAAVFLACAGVGAFIAAHTDPFPPGVDRPGASPVATRDASSSPSPAPAVRGCGSVQSVTYHDLYVGGRCTTRLAREPPFTVDSRAGSGHRARAAGRQASLRLPDRADAGASVRVAVVGGTLEGGVALRLSQASIDPTNGRDYGAFGAFLPIRMLLATNDNGVHERIDRRRVDEQGRGTYPGPRSSCSRRSGLTRLRRVPPERDDRPFLRAHVPQALRSLGAGRRARRRSPGRDRPAGRAVCGSSGWRLRDARTRRRRSPRRSPVPRGPS